MNPVETDRFKVSLNRKIPLVKVDSSVIYGINSTRMTAQVSKSLLPHLTCELATVQGFDPGRSGLGAASEETFVPIRNAIRSHPPLNQGPLV